jgi:hypothetical protein
MGERDGRMRESKSGIERMRERDENAGKEMERDTCIIKV